MGSVAALAVARVAFGFQFQSLAILGPELVARFGIDYAALGTLIGLYMLPGIVVALPGGLLGRRFGARGPVGAGLGLMCIGGLAPALLFGPAGIGFGRLLCGIGAAMLVVMQGKMISDRFPGTRFMPVMGLLIGAFPVGAGLVGVMHDLAAGWGPAGLFLIGAGLASVALLLFLNTVDDGAQVGANWAMPSRRECVLVAVAGLVWTAYNAGYYGFLSYVPSVLAARHHAAAEIGTAMTIATWTNLPATVVGATLAVRLGNTPIFLTGAVLGSVATAGLVFADWPLFWAALFGTAGALHAGVMIAIGTLSARPENRAVGMGLFYTIYYLGGTILPPLFGAAADYAGTPAGALLAASIVAALSIPVFYLHRILERW